MQPYVPSVSLPPGVAEQREPKDGLTACLLYKPMLIKMDTIIGLDELKHQVHGVFSGEPTSIQSLFSSAEEHGSNSFLFYGVRINCYYFGLKCIEWFVRCLFVATRHWKNFNCQCHFWTVPLRHYDNYSKRYFREFGWI